MRCCLSPSPSSSVPFTETALSTGAASAAARYTLGGQSKYPGAAGGDGDTSSLAYIALSATLNSRSCLQARRLACQTQVWQDLTFALQGLQTSGGAARKAGTEVHEASGDHRQADTHTAWHLAQAPLRLQMEVMCMCVGYGAFKILNFTHSAPARVVRYIA